MENVNKVTPEESAQGVEFVADKIEDILRHYIAESKDGAVTVTLGAYGEGFLFNIEQRG